MTSSERVIEGMSKISTHVLTLLRHDIDDLNKVSLARKFDRELTKRLIENP